MFPTTVVFKHSNLKRVIKMSTQLLQINTPIVSLDESRRFITDCMIAVCTPKANAQALANLLAEADYRGHYSHGMNRLEMYLSEIENGICKPDVAPEILKETPATAWVDGHGGLGVVVSTFSMQIAIRKAKEVGIGFVVCKGSNHYGIAGMYALQAMYEGLIGLSFTNSAPVVAPTRTKQAALGTNPISLAAPATKDNFVLDMATSAVALGKIEMKKRTKCEIPAQWVDPDTGVLQPLGGNEENSSYKGYGLAMLVEILCGILGGGAYGPNIREMENCDKMADLGHCFIAINPKCFSPGFKWRLADLMALLRNMEPVGEVIGGTLVQRHFQKEEGKPVMVAGDPEQLHMEDVDKMGGVRYVQDQWDTCNKIAKKLKVKPLEGIIGVNKVRI